MIREISKIAKTTALTAVAMMAAQVGKDFAEDWKQRYDEKRRERKLREAQQQ